MLASQSIFYDVHYFIVNSPVEFSNHCLISVYIKYQVQREITPEIKKTPVQCRVPDKEWSFQDGGLYIINKHILYDGDHS